jgi:hypothetical protein
MILLSFSLLDFIRIEKKIKNILFIFSCLILIFLITFRFNVPDYDSYVEIFQDVKFSFNIFENNDIHGEFGYLLLNSFVKLFGGNEIILFGIVGSLSIALTAVFYKKYTKYFLIATLLYFSHIFLLREMIQIRSGLAISIAMFSIPYIDKRNFTKFLGIILIASSVHSICLLFTLVYIFYPYLIKTKYQIVLLISGLIFGFTFELNVIENFLNLFNAPPIVIGYLFDEKYNFNLGLLNPVLIKNLIVVSILIYKKEFFEKRIKYFNVLLLSYIFGIFWLSTFNSFAIFSSRIATLFSNVEHVLIPSLLLYEKYKQIIYLMILFYCIYSFISKSQMLSIWSFRI